VTRARSQRSVPIPPVSEEPDEPAPSAPARRPSTEKRLTSINFASHHFEFLAKRGARSDRAHGMFSRSNVLRRKVDLFSAVLDRSNPLRTRDFPEPYVRLLGQLVPEPWTLSPDEIELFDRYIANRTELADLAKSAKIDSKDLVQRLAQLSFPERVALVDQIEQRLVPPPEE